MRGSMSLLHGFINKNAYVQPPLMTPKVPPEGFLRNDNFTYLNAAGIPLSLAAGIPGCFGTATNFPSSLSGTDGKNGLFRIGE